MTPEAKLGMVKAILRIDDTDTSEDALITTYLEMAAQEILGWRYSYAKAENVPENVPAEYEMTQVQAVINGYTQAGVEGQVLSIENGIHRHFNYSDMVEYIRSHVIPVAGVPRSSPSPTAQSAGTGEATPSSAAQTPPLSGEADGGEGG